MLSSGALKFNWIQGELRRLLLSSLLCPCLYWGRMGLPRARTMHIYGEPTLLVGDM